MNRWKQGVSNFAKMRRALLACVLGLCLVILWSGGVFATGKVAQIGPLAYLGSATDAGGGRIRITWFLQSEKLLPSHIFFTNTLPEKVCVTLHVVENGVKGPGTNTCFTGEVPSQSALVVDTGIGGDGPATVFSLYLTPYYEGIPLWPKVNGVWQWTEVTLNA